VAREDVGDWFENATDARRRYQDPPPEAGELLAKLVRRPGDPSRNSATSLSKREPQPQDQRPAGEGEWHGAIHRIDEQRDSRRDPAYDDREDRSGEFAEALREAEMDPSFYRSVMFQGVVDAHVGYWDRRYEGRRHRNTDGDEVMEGPQERPQHPGPVDDSRFHTF
jgi:hypothetical protein